MSEVIRLALVAGEASGDYLGGEFARSVIEQAPMGVEIRGVAGPEMIAAGVDPIFTIDELGVMGFGDVIMALPRLIGCFNRLAAVLEVWRPHALVTIDNQEFSLRLHERLAGMECRHIHYVAPQAWAWRPWRARRLARSVDRLLTLFPFEPAFFEPHGLACDHVGHPAVDRACAMIPVLRGPAEPSPERLCLMPGSRTAEIRRHLPLMLEAARSLRRKVVALEVVLPVVPTMRNVVSSLLSESDLDCRILDSDDRRWEIFANSRVAVACLGTATLELALSGCPMVAIYRTDALSAVIARHLVRTPYLSLPNILLDMPIVPEMVQDGLDCETLQRTLDLLWFDDHARGRQIGNFARLRSIMQPPHGQTAARTAAHAVLKEIV
ncbi:MAG: lipid-A-disaccharide synthase [Geminicoccaceae bacterium]